MMSEAFRDDFDPRKGYLRKKVITYILLLIVVNGVIALLSFVNINLIWKFIIIFLSISVFYLGIRVMFNFWENQKEKRNERRVIIKKALIAIDKNHFHILASFDDYQLKEIFNYFEKRMELLKNMAPVGRNIITKYNQQKNYRDLKQFKKYYHFSLKELANKVVKEQTISEYERERLISESFLEIRSFLEENLHKSHPIIQSINEQQTLQTKNGYKILK